MSVLRPRGRSRGRLRGEEQVELSAAARVRDLLHAHDADLQVQLRAQALREGLAHLRDRSRWEPFHGFLRIFFDF